MLGRIAVISVSSTSDDLLLETSGEPELLANEDSLYYINVNISSKDAVANNVINAQVCFTATDDFGLITRFIYRLMTVTVTVSAP